MSSGRNFHFIFKLPIHCTVNVFFFFKLTLPLLIIYITLYCKLFSGLSHVFVDQL